MRCINLLAAIVCVGLAWAQPALAQLEEATRIEIADYYFAYTVEKFSLVQGKNELGFTALHNPSGGGKGTKPDYGITVRAGYYRILSKSEAEAIGIDVATLEPHATDEAGNVYLIAEDILSNTVLASLMTDVMASEDIEVAGQAEVMGPGGARISMPYFTWSVTQGAKTAHACFYTVMHGDWFVSVQVESKKPFSRRQLEWFTSHLELLELPLAWREAHPEFGG